MCVGVRDLFEDGDGEIKVVGEGVSRYELWGDEEREVEIGFEELGVDLLDIVQFRAVVEVAYGLFE